MVFLRTILVDIGTFDGEQNNFWNKSILMKIKEWYHVYLTSNKTEVTSVKLVLLKFVMLFDSLTKVDQLSEIVRFG